MSIKIFIDSNAWDIFFNDRVDLTQELPNPDYSLYITREAEFEIKHMPERIQEYVKQQLNSSKVQTDAYFGFYDDSLSPEEQRVGGFGDPNDPSVGGRFITEEEAAFIKSESIGSSIRPTGLFKNEADISLAARSLNSVVLTCDGKKALKRAKCLHAGLVIDLKNYQKGSSLANFIKAQMAASC